MCLLSWLLQDTPFGERLWWNWERDDVLYHDWDAFIHTLAETNTRVMTYINPYLANTVTRDKKHFHRDLFKEAAKHGYLIKVGIPTRSHTQTHTQTQTQTHTHTNTHTRTRAHTHTKT